MRARLRCAAVLFTAVSAGCGSPHGPDPPVNATPDAPKITCPAAPPAATSPTGQPIAVVYGTATVTGGATPVSLSCVPPSGTSFPVSSTPVTCTATDSRQRTDSCTFNVVVQANPKLTLTRFLAFGDSITAGEDGTPIDQCTFDDPLTTTQSLPLPRITPYDIVGTPYPARLKALLQSFYPGQSGSITVDNGGKKGEPVYNPLAPGGQQAPDRLHDLLVAGSYQALLLMEGSNDIFYGNPARIDLAINGLRAMLRDAQSRNVRPFLATVPPMVAGMARACGAQLVDVLNGMIRSLAMQENATLVDVQAGLGADLQQYIGNDGLHPTQAGYLEIAEIFREVIVSTLEAPAATTTALTPRAAAPVPLARPSIAPRSGPRR